MNEISTVVNRANLLLTTIQGAYQSLEGQKLAAEAKIAELLQQQDLIERSKVALDQAKPLLSATSIRQLEALANTAVSTIFDLEGQVSFDIESRRFIIADGDKVCDLADACGGGLVTVISFVFDLFLLIKSGARRLLVYDEAFYAVSDQYYDSFVSFMKQSCKDLGVDLLLVSHDARLTTSMVDTAYRIVNGKSIKVK